MDSGGSRPSTPATEPVLPEGARVLVAPSPPGATPRLVEASVVHVDIPTGRLILAWSPTASEILVATAGTHVLVLVPQPGEGLFARPCVVEAALESAEWRVLRPVESWQRLERRLAERAAVVLPVVGYRYPTTGGGLVLRGTVQDLSSTGLLLGTSERVNLSDRVTLEVPLPDGEGPLRVQVVVVRVQRAPEGSHVTWSAGCQFQGLGPAEQTRVASFVAAQRQPS